MLKVIYNLNEFIFQNWNDFMINGIQNKKFYNVHSYRVNKSNDESLSVSVNDVYDLHSVINDGIIELIVNDISVMRHTAAHVLAHAIHRTYKDILFGIGPVTESGFFYDIYTTRSIGELKKAMPKIIEEMKHIINENISLEKSYVSKEYFLNNHKDEIKKYIAENIITEDSVSIYTQGDFYDLCKGPHLLNTGLLKDKVFNFLEASQVTWHNFSMIRLTFDLFNNCEELHEYYSYLNDFSEEDHRVLFKDMELCLFPEVCSGMVLWQPNGLKVLDKLKGIILKIFHYYQHVITPPICKNTLWERTGHLTKYRDLMFVVDEEAFKPMNCPEHTLFFKSKIRSYRDLPFRVFEFGEVFRNEAEGGLNGCKRLRNFTQDDGHIFCTLDQCKDEIFLFMKGALHLYKFFGFNDIKIVIATRPKQSIGTDDEWNDGIRILKEVVESMNLPYEVDVGGGAFYGPKIELHIAPEVSEDKKDKIKSKRWQCGTIQIDYFLSKNLGAKYVDSENNMNSNMDNDDNIDKFQKYPIVLHRAALGSLQRFLAILTEHHKGLPISLHFCPVRILPITSNNQDMINKCEEIHEYLKKNNIISEVCVDGTLQKRIKLSNILHIPYLIIIGEKEIKDNTISVRYENKQSTTTLELLVKELLLKQNI